MIVVIGSKNKAKIRGVKRAFSILGDFKYRSLKLDTLVKQPIGLKETFLGAVFRAVKSYDSLGGEKGFGVGVEAGILEIENILLSGQVVVVTDGVKYSVGLSSYFPLPPKIYGELLSREELGVLMEKISEIKDIAESIGAIGYLTNGFITRVDLTYQATVSAIIPWLNTELYGELPRYSELIETLKRRVNNY
ncbi:MAG: hypothetical protein B6U89_04435 [Desulfurococcales archaeon ex4484_58]|nr:MAG: hypothetical protein B6U89_04435 [Desulfurococcales archaeon ex4484_58]